MATNTRKAPKPSPSPGNIRRTLARLFINGAYLHASNLAQGSFGKGTLTPLYVKGSIANTPEVLLIDAHHEFEVRGGRSRNVRMRVMYQFIRDGYLQADLPPLSRPCGINQVHSISSRDTI